ncbi:MAG: DUF1631 domain-containing protein [Pseudomonadota bacterium]
MSDIVEKLKEESVAALTDMLREVLLRAEKGVVDQIGGFLTLSQHQDDILAAFAHNMNNYFDELMGKPIDKVEPVYNFETLSLVKDDDLEIMVALEGMVNSARNAQLPNFISFNTRLNTLFDNKRIDESTNPLDPSQIATAFKDAIASLNMDAQNSLSVYRRFNTDVLLQLDKVLSSGNKLLISHGVIPHLGMDSGGKQKPVARSRPRQTDPIGFGTVEEDPFEPDAETPELFSMMQNLLHPGSPGSAGAGATTSGVNPAGAAAQTSPVSGGPQYAVPASMIPSGAQAGVMTPFTPAPGEQVQMVDQGQLMAILTNIQKTLAERSANESGPQAAGKAEKIDISSTLGEMLKESQAEGVVAAVDRQSSDIINLVTMLYEAIWQDESVPIPIKELIGRTQITIIKVALSDTTFFNRENHPARTILNDFAEAGIGWTEVEELEADPLYQKIQDLVRRIQNDYTGDESFFEGIIKEFRRFRAQEVAKTRVLEQRILKAQERQERLGDIHELVTQKIDERLLGRDIDSFIQELLEGPFHKFMVMLVLKEGPGTNAWKQAINTIDVLLWTIQSHEHSGDRERLETVNPRLLNNLRKAFRIAQVPPEEIDTLITRLKSVQDSSFAPAAEAPAKTGAAAETREPTPAVAAAPTSTDTRSTPVEFSSPATEQDEDDGGELSDNAPEVRQVDQLHVGIWVEFIGEDDVSVRCKLAARINAIDKYIFVNRQGVKVVEKTRMGLARELRDGTVRIISDGLLFSRALESVIGNLRESQQEQHTASAYQPGKESSPA